MTSLPSTAAGQYLDGTTDVTRTMHYGQPSEFQREAYTRVLMGAIDLADLVVNSNTADTQVGQLAMEGNAAPFRSRATYFVSGVGILKRLFQHIQ